MKIQNRPVVFDQPLKVGGRERIGQRACGWQEEARNDDYTSNRDGAQPKKTLHLDTSRQARRPAVVKVCRNFGGESPVVAMNIVADSGVDIKREFSVGLWFVQSGQLPAADRQAYEKGSAQSA